MGHSKGFGFVEMDTDAQAQATIQGLNDCEYEGRWLMCERDRATGGSWRGC